MLAPAFCISLGVKLNDLDYNLLLSKSESRNRLAYFSFCSLRYEKRRFYLDGSFSVSARIDSVLSLTNLSFPLRNTAFGSRMFELRFHKYFLKFTKLRLWFLQANQLFDDVNQRLVRCLLLLISDWFMHADI